LPRFALPSLPVLLLAGAGWWWFTNQRAPRASDVDRLVKSASRTADQLLNEAKQAARSVQQSGGDAGTTTPPAANSAGTGAAPTGTPSGAPTSALGNPAPSGAETTLPNTERPTPSTAPSGRAISPLGQAARTTLDSLTKALDPGSATDDDARSAIPALRSVLLRLPTAEDSTWAYIRIAEAHLLLDEVRPACTALRSARGTARTMNQADIITRYSGQLGCAQ
jgi:serine/threonine-protein kinase